MSQPNLNEDLNIVSNSNLTITYLDGNLDIIQQLDDEPNDVGGLTAAELKAKFDEAGNIIKTYINGTLIPEILAEDATEEARAAAEEARVTAEAERQSAEEARASAEATRQSNEENRESNEAARVAAEALRVSAETAREQAESGRITAEEARVAAENLRASAEELRASAEQARAAAEQNRVAAEQGRSTAEQARSTAETARETAEAARAAAEQARADENTGIVAQATTQAQAAAGSATKAAASEAAAKSSETAAKTSETNAKASETAAAGSAAAASDSETNAKSSETAAKTSETNAKASETAAAGSAATAQEAARDAAASASQAAEVVGGDFATRSELAEKQKKLYNLVLDAPIVENQAIDDNSTFALPSAIPLTEGDQYWADIQFVRDVDDIARYQMLSKAVANDTGVTVAWNNGQITLTTAGIATSGIHGKIIITIAKVVSYESSDEGPLTYQEGHDCVASGVDSHVEGYGTEASGSASHAEGFFTTASNYSSHAQGKYSKAMTTGGAETNTTGDAMVIGNGTGSSARSNAFRVTFAGAVYGLSAFNSTGADYSEFFEWADLNPAAEDRVGYFVTLVGKQIRMAGPGDYILGIVSGQPCIIGNADEDWLGRWEHDAFGRFIKEDTEDPVVERKMVEVPVLDDSGNPTGKTKLEMQEVETGEVIHGWRYKANPDYDQTQEYIERKDRPEWDCVGMLGVLAVRDDGTCGVNGYCRVADGGIATAADAYIPGTTYRVIERVADNVIKVIFR